MTSLWDTLATFVAPASGLVEHHDTTPPPSKPFTAPNSRKCRKLSHTASVDAVAFLTAAQAAEEFRKTSALNLPRRGLLFACRFCDPMAGA
jgi:hypothetical protein